MPLETGSTSVSVMAVARIASTALPPSASICRPACAASGWVVDTTFAASTGLRGQAYGFCQVKAGGRLGVISARILSAPGSGGAFEVEHHPADHLAGLQVLERGVC